MESFQVSFDYRFVSTSSIRCLDRLKPYSPIEISSSLGLMGFSSWASLTNPKVGLGKTYKLIIVFLYVFILYIQYEKCFNASFVTSIFIETFREKSDYIKKKLDDALKIRLDDIEARREAKRQKEINKRKSKKNKNKNCHRKFKIIKQFDVNDSRNKKLSLTQEERKVHEAYQMLLSEYPKRIRMHLRHKRPP